MKLVSPIPLTEREWEFVAKSEYLALDCAQPRTDDERELFAEIRAIFQKCGYFSLLNNEPVGPIGPARAISREEFVARYVANVMQC